MNFKTTLLSRDVLGENTRVMPLNLPGRMTNETGAVSDRLLSCFIAALFLGLAGSVCAEEKKSSIDFHTQVLPLFETHCFSCHGSERQRSDLRLDVRSAARKGGSLGPVWIPGDGAGSRLVQYVQGNPEDMQMPPKGDLLTADEIQVLKAWIDQGASWPLLAGEVDDNPLDTHWAFQPVSPQLPAAHEQSVEAVHPVKPLDRFIDAKLAEKGLTRTERADRRTLLRRLYMVMLGVPPTPEEVAAFEADPHPDAFERIVDQVLEDPRYGERWARHWLDVIRFAETNGFETNRERLTAWRFRDYVIEALNQDMPYDQFVREQIAGDALGADVATGFLVGGPVDIVRSPDPVLTAQQRADELDDMVNTTGTAFMGLTLGCARCHSHKFDPVSHNEYHSMAALFAGVQHGERPAPLSSEQVEVRKSLQAEIRDLESKLEKFIPEDEQVVRGGVKSDGTEVALLPAVQARVNEEPLEPLEAVAVRFTILATNGGQPGIDELEVWSGETNVALSSAGTQATASGSLTGYAIHKLEHVNDGEPGNNHSWISDELGRGWVNLEFPEPARIDRIVWGRDRSGQFGDRIAVRYRIEARIQSGEWVLVAGSHRREPYTGSVQEQKTPLYDFAQFSVEDANQGQAWLETLKKKRAELDQASKAASLYAGTFGKPETIHRLHRGDPMQKREEIAPGSLAIFDRFELPINASEQERRVQLAHWIAHQDNPLTARVLVNRVWQYHFGVGIVDTPNDFGLNGSRPTHPELLDWLASEFVREGWSLKRLHRNILLSATWQQSGVPNEKALQVDASSRLLWRFPPRRLEAEAIRDGILFVSGSLNPRMGGSSFYLHEVDRENVYHYHPKESFGPEESRRMIYAFKVRMEPDGIFGSFDCPDGSLAVPRRSISTTPLQALNLFNSVFVMEQVEHLVERLTQEEGENDRARIRRLWDLAYGRSPDASEIQFAVNFAQNHGLDAVCRAVLNSNEFLFLP